MQSSKIDLMENVPVNKAIIKLALPTMLGMVVQLIYNMTDTYFIGKTGNPNLVAAISLVGPIFLAIQAVGNIFANGTSSYISRMLGAKEYVEAKHSSSVAIYLSAIIGIAITATLLLFKNRVLGMIGTSPDTMEPTSAYLTIIIIFASTFILQTSFAGLIRSEGATGIAMMGMVIGLGINIILDPVFILLLHMGTAGAAWATVIGNAFGLCFYIYHLLSKKTLLSIKFRDFKPSKIILSETFKIGVPSAANTLVMSISFVLMNVLAASYGDYVVAGNGIFMRVSSLVIMITMGLTLGYQPFAGYNYGAKNFHRLKDGFKITMIYGTCISLFFTAIFLLFGRSIIGIFISDAETIEAGAQILKAFSWCVPFFGIQFTLMVTFLATGKALKAMIISLGRQCIIFIPLLLISNNLYGFSGFIYAQPIADIITTLIAVGMSFSFVKEMNSLHEDEINFTECLECS